MPSDAIAQCFRDIANAIRLIQEWVRESGGVEEAIHHNVLIRSAIERQLLVISEAAIRLNKLDSTCASSLAPGIDWAGVRGIGNFIRHKYDELDIEVIAETVANRLDELNSGAEAALKLIERESARTLSDLGGSDPEAKAPPRRRPPRS